MSQNLNSIFSCKNYKKNDSFLGCLIFSLSFFWEKNMHFLNIMNHLNFFQFNWHGFCLRSQQVNKMAIDLVTPCTKPPPSIWYCVIRQIQMKTFEAFFTGLARWAKSFIESQCLSVCMFVTLWKTHFRVFWTPLVKEHIPCYINLWVWCHN